MERLKKIGSSAENLAKLISISLIQSYYLQT